MESSEAQGIVDARKAKIGSERISVQTNQEQAQTPLPNQEQTQIPTQAPEKRGAFGFLDFFKRMKGQKTTSPPSGSQPYRTPDGEFGLKMPNNPPPINTNTVSNPEYNATTAPDNISPINESVASGGRLPTEPQEEQKA